MSDHEHLRSKYEWMNEDQWLCFEMLCDLFGGAHHLKGRIHYFNDKGIQFNSTNANHRMATFDFDMLTRAVFLAHDRMIRFAIEGGGPGMLKLILIKRHSRDGAMYERHPTVEQALITHRRFWRDTELHAQQKESGACPT